MTNPSNSRYYILDALGHTRQLLDNTGNITDTYVYDAWGNLLKGSEFNTPNPFTWNGAYGYVWIEFTGLYHVGAREYDPRTARWLQRDPIGVGGGDPNLYRYCFGHPTGFVDPSGTEIVIFIHGSNSSPSVFINDRSLVSAVKSTLQAKGHVFIAWNGNFPAGARPPHIESEGQRLAGCIRDIKAKHPNEPIFVYGHSNGGNIAGAAARAGAPIDLIIRVASPYYPGMIDVPDGVSVVDFFDPRDKVQFGWAVDIGNAYRAEQVARLFGKSSEWDGWQRFQVDSGCKERDDIHSNYMRSERAWKEWMSELVSQWLNRRIRR